MPINLGQALEHHRAGRLDLAKPIYEAALAEDPRRDEAYHLLGLVNLQAGEPAKAVEQIARAVALRPDRADYHSALGEACWAMGRIDLAVESAREACQLRPDDAELLCNLGSSLVEAGQGEAGVEALRSSLRLNPDLLPAHNNLGQALAIRGDLASARVHFAQAVRLDPTSADAQANLGKVLLDQGDAEGAVRHGAEAIRLRPGFFPALISLGQALQELDRLEEAEACLREAIRLRPRSAAPAWAELGAVLEQKGETDASIAAFREALRLDPRHSGSLARLATRLRDKLPRGDEAAIESLSADSGLPLDRRAALLFGLAHVEDARGKFERAAHLSTEANRAQRADLERRGRGYDPEAHSRFVDQLIEGFDGAFFDRVRGWGESTDRPIFVVGMPRSGTSLVEQILASHPEVFGAGELRLAGEVFQALPEPGESLKHSLARLDPTSIPALARRYLEGLARRNPSAKRVVDKMPENLLYLGLIAAILPGSKIIHCRRDPRDVALSCWMTHFGRVRWSCDPDHIASRIFEADRALSHWHKVLPTPIFEVDYELLVEDLEGTSRRLLTHCDLTWDPACLEFHKTVRAVRTASTAQVRRPIHRGSVARWKHYETSLAPLFEAVVHQRSTDPESSRPIKDPIR